MPERMEQPAAVVSKKMPDRQNNSIPRDARTHHSRQTSCCFANGDLSHLQPHTAWSENIDFRS